MAFTQIDVSAMDRYGSMAVREHGLAGLREVKSAWRVSDLVILDVAAARTQPPPGRFSPSPRAIFMTVAGFRHAV